MERDDVKLVVHVFSKTWLRKILVNDRTMEDYFGGRIAAHMVVKPLVLLDMADKFDVVNVQVVVNGPSWCNTSWYYPY